MCVELLTQVAPPVRSIVIFVRFTEGCMYIKSHCVVRDHKSIYIRPWHFFQKKFDEILFSNFPGPIPNPGKLLNRISKHPPLRNRHGDVWWGQNAKSTLGFYSLSGETSGLMARFHHTCSTTLKRSRDLRSEYVVVLQLIYRFPAFLFSTPSDHDLEMAPLICL